MADGMHAQLLQAEWAWISKEPGSGDDYRVMAASPGPIGVRNLVWTNVVGVPSGALSPDAPGAPPWWTFGAHSAGEDPVVSVSLQYPAEADNLDGAGRETWPRFFCACRFGEMASCAASYQTLSAAIVRSTENFAELDSEYPQPIPLEVRPQRLDGKDGLVAAVHEFGVTRLAVIAAALVDSQRVAVTGAAELTWPARVRLLDAIMALLPYGCRAAVTASTSVDRKITHEIPLVITDFPDESQVVVGLRSRPPALPRGTGLEYLQKLLDRGKDSGWDEVLRHLWNARKQCSPAQALTILEDFHANTYLWKDIRKAKVVPLKNALAALQGPADAVAASWSRERNLDPETVRKVLVTLLDSPESAAADAVIRNWQAVDDDLATLVNTDLNRGSLDRARRSLMVTNRADSPQLQDRLLKKLLVPVHTRKPYDDPIRHRVALMCEAPIPAPNAFQDTCNALRFDEIAAWQARFIYALLTEEDRADPAGKRAPDWARWLCASDFPRDRKPPEWFSALSLAVPNARRESDGSVRAVLQRDADWILVIARLAAHFNRMPVLFAVPGLDTDIVQLALRWGTASTGDHAPGGDRAARLAAALSTPLRRAKLPLGTVACVDISRVLLDGQLRDFPHDTPGPDGAEEFRQYLDGLGRGFRYLEELPGRGDRVTHLFLKHLIPADGVPVESVSAGVQRLIMAWSEDGARAPLVARYLADLLQNAGILPADPDDGREPLIDGADQGLAGLLVSKLSPLVWKRLAGYDGRLLPVGPMKQLEATVKAGIDNPREAFRRGVIRLPPNDQQPDLPNGGKRITALALAIYDAFFAGISTRGILNVIKTEYDHAPYDRRLTPALLGRVLGEFQELIRDHQPDDGLMLSDDDRRQLAAFSDLVWLACYEEILVGGVLGVPFARDLARDLDKVLAGRIGYLDRMRQAFPAKQGIFGFRARLGSRRLGKWYQTLDGEARDIGRLRSRSPRQADGGPRALSQGGVGTTGLLGPGRPGSGR
jgi:hypothetical protein